MEITPGFDTVEIAMDPSGFVEARTGASPHGQGLRTTLAQIIADQIGITPDMVQITHGDTDNSPYGFGTFASRSIVIAGGAALLAATKLRQKLTEVAGHLLEASPADIRLEMGNAVIVGTNRGIPIATLARTAYLSADKLGNLSPGLRESATYDPGGTFSNACHVAVVEVDPQTGAVKLDRYLVVEDAGRLVNPMIAEGQIHGGVAQGIANALFEEIIYNDQGEILTATLADYLVPTMAEIPHIEVQHLETLTSHATITKAKGLGEGGTIGAPAAVLNAVNDALSPFRVEINEFPATPKRIREIMRTSLENRT
jgi:aerobic carbon-monoxide dehydrogenase large subunit